ncbi:hypothetical protein [Corynebacterium sp. H78]|uniref:hypothetical protein n=1 Tax=Corynebacterium sp. H78 TaxID=3133417 RepID=UPI00309EF157
MNFEETKYWYGQIFPGDMQLSEHAGRVFGVGRFDVWGDAAPVQIAEFSVSDTDSAVATANLSRVDYELRTPDQQDVRVELVMVGSKELPLHEILATAAGMISEAPTQWYPQPGRVLTHAITTAVSALLHADDEVRGKHGSGASDDDAVAPLTPMAAPDAAQTGVTTPHLLCIVPSLWSQGAPQVTEVPGQVSMSVGDSKSPGGRITTMSQLIPITNDEAEFLAHHPSVTAAEGSAEADPLAKAGVYSMAAQDLMHKFVAAGTDLRDLTRESVTGL